MPSLRAVLAGKFIRRPPEFVWLTLIAALLATFGLYQYRAWQEDSAEGPVLPNNVELVMHDLEATRSMAGAVQWKLTAKQARQSMDDDTTALDAVRMLVVDSEDGDIVITADSGAILPHGDTMSARSNVVIELADATRLLTESLVYDANTGVMSSTDPVRMEAGAMTASGTGMEVEVKQRRFTLQGGVQAVAQP